MPDVIKSSTTFSHGRGCPKSCPLIAQPLSLNVTLNSFSGSRSVFPSLCCLVCAQNLKAGRLQVLRNCTNCVYLTQICHAIRFRYDVPHVRFKPMLSSKKQPSLGQVRPSGSTGYVGRAMPEEKDSTCQRKGCLGKDEIYFDRIHESLGVSPQLVKFVVLLLYTHGNS